MKVKKNLGGRPPLDPTKKRSNRICVYMTDQEFKSFEVLKNRLSSSSPALLVSDFLREIIVNHNSDLFDLYGIELNDPLETTFLKTKRNYSKK